MYRFCCISSRFFRWFLGAFSGPSLHLLFIICPLLPIWLLVFLVFRRLFFVRFPRPSGFRAGLPWFRGFWFVFSWSCVSAASLPALRRCCFVWSLRPAVVSRRSGVVLAFWVLWSPSPDGNQAAAEPQRERRQSRRRRCCFSATVHYIFLGGFIMTSEVNYIIRQRAAAKRDRAIARTTKEDSLRDWVPFTEYLLHAKGVEDWHALGKYMLTDYYLDYELECLMARMEYEHPSRYGITVSLMK